MVGNSDNKANSVQFENWAGTEFGKIWLNSDKKLMCLAHKTNYVDTVLGRQLKLTKPKIFEHSPKSKLKKLQTERNLNSNIGRNVVLKYV